MVQVRGGGGLQVGVGQGCGGGLGGEWSQVVVGSRGW